MSSREPETWLDQRLRSVLRQELGQAAPRPQTRQRLLARARSRRPVWRWPVQPARAGSQWDCLAFFNLTTTCGPYCTPLYLWR